MEACLISGQVLTEKASVEVSEISHGSLEMEAGLVSSEIFGIDTYSMVYTSILLHLSIIDFECPSKQTSVKEVPNLS